MADAKVITYEELKAHTTKDSIYLLLHQKVYDVTKFIDEHPGGDEVILAETGKDATEAFEDVGHSDEARSILQGLLVGEFEKDGELKVKSTYGSSSSSNSTVNAAVQQGSKCVFPCDVSCLVPDALNLRSMMYFVPLAVLGAYFAWRYYSSGTI
ncbi:hypothetical protein AcV7_008109 [Taiwanofungus camphoratus]|nr:hypothetical protein AcV7_008109 [Antrodia cinnamomea]